MNRNLLLITLSLLGGCATQVPIPQNFDVAYQKKVKASQHWDVVAGDIADQTAKALKKSSLEGASVNVVPAESTTPFTSVFRELLITRLVNKGVPVAQSGGAAINVSYKPQLVTHGSDRSYYRPWTTTALAGGLMVARNIADHGSGDLQAVGILGAVAAADYLTSQSAGPATHTELVLTTSISRNGGYVMRKSDIYYIEDADLSLFMEPTRPPELKTFRVVGDK